MASPLSQKGPFVSVGFLILAVHAAQLRWNIESNPLSSTTSRSDPGSLRTLAHPSVPLGLHIFIALSPIQLARKVGPNGTPRCSASSMLPPPKRAETARYKKEEWD